VFFCLRKGYEFVLEGFEALWMELTQRAEQQQQQQQQHWQLLPQQLLPLASSRSIGSSSSFASAAVSREPDEKVTTVSQCEGPLGDKCL
jgi:hypothetical protein